MSCYYYLLHNGYIHIHHYFIGLVIMLVSRNYHSKIVVIAHAISYAIYIEGISGYGFGKYRSIFIHYIVLKKKCIIYDDICNFNNYT